MSIECVNGREGKTKGSCVTVNSVSFLSQAARLAQELVSCHTYIERGHTIRSSDDILFGMWAILWAPRWTMKANIKHDPANPKAMFASIHYSSQKILCDLKIVRCGELVAAVLADKRRPLDLFGARGALLEAGPIC
jgi:hypothetical protein